MLLIPIEWSTHILKITIVKKQNLTSLFGSPHSSLAPSPTSHETACTDSAANDVPCRSRSADHPKLPLSTQSASRPPPAVQACRAQLQLREAESMEVEASVGEGAASQPPAQARRGLVRALACGGGSGGFTAAFGPRRKVQIHSPLSVWALAPALSALVSLRATFKTCQ